MFGLVGKWASVSKDACVLLFDIMFLFIFFESDLPKNLENEFDLFKRLFVLLLLISVDFEDFE